MRKIHITKIHNHTRPRVDVQLRNVDGSTLTVPPDETLEGSWFICYDEREHPELYNVAPENQMWFSDSPTDFKWGAVTFDNPGGQRLQVADWIALYDAEPEC